MQQILLLIHVVAVIVWIGGATFHIFASRRVAGADPAVGKWWAEVGAAAGKQYYMPASIVTLLAGIGLVLSDDAWSFADPFVSIGFAGIIISAVLGAVMITRATDEMVAEMESGAPDQGRLEALGQRVGMLSSVDVVVLLVVVWAMVAKPGM